MRRWMSVPIGLWLVSEGLVFSSPQAVSESPRARISGRVLSTEGKPLSRAVVTAQRRGGVATFQAKTDRSGRYTLEVEPGTYFIRAEKGGYVATAYSVEGTASDPTPITVEAGKSVTIDLRLARGGVITGRILDEDGEPLVGAIVTAERKREESLGGAVSEMARTDDRGVYRIYGLASGRYYVSARVPEQQLVRISTGAIPLLQEGAVTYYPGVSSRQQAAEVEVVEGAETTGIDFKIVAEKERALVFGVVRKQESGEPLPGALVYAYSLGSPSTGARATTDEQGRYELRGLMPGIYNIQVSPTLLPYEDYAPPLPQIVTVEQEPIEVNFELGRAAEISGRILTEEGRVPENVVRFTPLLRVKGAERHIIAAAMPRVDPQGNFTLTRVPGGTFLFDVALADSPYFLRAVLHENRDIAQEGISVSPGARVTDVMIVLSDAGATVRGRVLAGESETPLPNAVVLLVPTDFVRRFAEKRSFDSRSVVSDQHGGYELKGIPPGRYYLVVFPKRPTFQRPEEQLEFLTARAAQLPVLDLKAREIKRLDVRPTVKE
ncbi:MAG: carboxypeptidase-like regulatory domain-containing protein [Blastocatellia bacterium]|nr:carboxypeptidase-like regulatory domain-containing protein [Blastocatellia bacterium]MCX7752943.1 carboxypeptidase-like regulatory domain-containing protein [Blastocatellia bacterium]MDW8168466.1 carboxypeptidase regulatory-like domain-containing protein [Acidobacteriota bacterium]